MSLTSRTRQRPTNTQTRSSSNNIEDKTSNQTITITVPFLWFWTRQKEISAKEFLDDLFATPPIHLGGKLRQPQFAFTDEQLAKIRRINKSPPLTENEFDSLMQQMRIRYPNYVHTYECVTLDVLTIDYNKKKLSVPRDENSQYRHLSKKNPFVEPLQQQLREELFEHGCLSDAEKPFVVHYKEKVRNDPNNPWLGRSDHYSNRSLQGLARFILQQSSYKDNQWTVNSIRNVINLIPQDSNLRKSEYTLLRKEFDNLLEKEFLRRIGITFDAVSFDDIENALRSLKTTIYKTLNIKHDESKVKSRETRNNSASLNNGILYEIKHSLFGHTIWTTRISVHSFLDDFFSEDFSWDLTNNRFILTDLQMAKLRDLKNKNPNIALLKEQARIYFIANMSKNKNITTVEVLKNAYQFFDSDIEKLVTNTSTAAVPSSNSNVKKSAEDNHGESEHKGKPVLARGNNDPQISLSPTKMQDELDSDMSTVEELHNIILGLTPSTSNTESKRHGSHSSTASSDSKSDGSSSEHSPQVSPTLSASPPLGSSINSIQSQLLSSKKGRRRSTTSSSSNSSASPQSLPSSSASSAASSLSLSPTAATKTKTGLTRRRRKPLLTTNNPFDAEPSTNPFDSQPSENPWDKKNDLLETAPRSSSAATPTKSNTEMDGNNTTVEKEPSHTQQQPPRQPTSLETSSQEQKHLSSPGGSKTPASAHTTHDHHRDTQTNNSNILITMLESDEKQQNDDLDELLAQLSRFYNSHQVKDQSIEEKLKHAIIEYQKEENKVHRKFVVEATALAASTAKAGLKTAWGFLGKYVDTSTIASKFPAKVREKVSGTLAPAPQSPNYLDEFNKMVEMDQLNALKSLLQHAEKRNKEIDWENSTPKDLKCYNTILQFFPSTKMTSSAQSAPSSAVAASQQLRHRSLVTNNGTPSKATTIPHHHYSHGRR